MRLLVKASASNIPRFVASNIDQLAGLNLRALILMVGMMTHILTINGHRRGGRFGTGTMSFVIGATGERDKRNCGKAGEDQVLNHRCVF